VCAGGGRADRASAAAVNAAPARAADRWARLGVMVIRSR
jgi:hypothetical protein